MIHVALAIRGTNEVGCKGSSLYDGPPSIGEGALGQAKKADTTTVKPFCKCYCRELYVQCVFTMLCFCTLYSVSFYKFWSSMVHVIWWFKKKFISAQTPLSGFSLQTAHPGDDDLHILVKNKTRVPWRLRAACKQRYSGGITVTLDDRKNSIKCRVAQNNVRKWH